MLSLIILTVACLLAGYAIGEASSRPRHRRELMIALRRRLGEPD